MEKVVMSTAPVIILPIRPGRILVVDDDSGQKRLMKEILAGKGHFVTEAGDGEEALVEIRREPPDVILLDLVMPRLDGFEVCRRVKSSPATALIHIIIMTSLWSHDQRLKGIECGANDFLVKPVEREEVLLRVRNALMAKQAIEALQRHTAVRDMENEQLHRLHCLAVSDGLALDLLTLGAEMMAWRVAIGPLAGLELERLHEMYKQLGILLTKSGPAPV